MYLYRATGDPTLLELGRDAVESIEKISKVECGFATVSVSGPLATNKPRWLRALERGGERLYTVKGERSGKTGQGRVTQAGRTGLLGRDLQALQELESSALLQAGVVIGQEDGSVEEAEKFLFGL